jgi:hypothetical protein
MVDHQIGPGRKCTRRVNKQVPWVRQNAQAQEVHDSVCPLVLTPRASLKAALMLATLVSCLVRPDSC